MPQTTPSETCEKRAHNCAIKRAKRDLTVRLRALPGNEPFPNPSAAECSAAKGYNACRRGKQLAGGAKPPARQAGWNRWISFAE